MSRVTWVLNLSLAVSYIYIFYFYIYIIYYIIYILYYIYLYNLYLYYSIVFLNIELQFCRCSCQLYRFLFRKNQVLTSNACIFTIILMSGFFFKFYFMKSRANQQTYRLVAGFSNLVLVFLCLWSQWLTCDLAMELHFNKIECKLIAT